LIQDFAAQGLLKLDGQYAGLACSGEIINLKDLPMRSWFLLILIYELLNIESKLNEEDKKV
jgi:hypothetical protein